MEQIVERRGSGAFQQLIISIRPSRGSYDRRGNRARL
ncbi:MAG: hypothetical protein ACI9W6_002703 [Motiliproteus sp.]